MHNRIEILSWIERVSERECGGGGGSFHERVAAFHVDWARMTGTVIRSKRMWFLFVTVCPKRKGTTPNVNHNCIKSFRNRFSFGLKRPGNRDRRLTWNHNAFSQRCRLSFPIILAHREWQRPRPRPPKKWTIVAGARTVRAIVDLAVNGEQYDDKWMQSKANNELLAFKSIKALYNDWHTLLFKVILEKSKRKNIRRKHL